MNKTNIKEICIKLKSFGGFELIKSAELRPDNEEWPSRHRACHRRKRKLQLSSINESMLNVFLINFHFEFSLDSTKAKQKPWIGFMGTKTTKIQSRTETADDRCAWVLNARPVNTFESAISNPITASSNFHFHIYTNASPIIIQVNEWALLLLLLRRQLWMSTSPERDRVWWLCSERVWFRIFQSIHFVQPTNHCPHEIRFNDSRAFCDHLFLFSLSTKSVKRNFLTGPE